MNKLNFDLSDPNCDVRALFIDFKSDFRGMANGKFSDIRHGFMIDIYDVQAWIGNPERGPNRYTPTESELKLYNALIHIWVKAGYLTKSVREYKQLSMSGEVYQITEKGWDQK